MGVFGAGRVLTNGNIVSVVRANVATSVVREVGVSLSKLALKKAGARLAGKVLIKSKAWQKAFLHIAEHFTVDALAHKATHGVFAKALRSPKALERLIVSAVKSPSRKFISRATIEGVARGKPVVIIEREFGEVIGDVFVNEGGKIVQQTVDKVVTETVQEVVNGKIVTKTITKTVKVPVQCKILRIVVDFTGRPITAIPVAEFL